VHAAAHHAAVKSSGMSRCIAAMVVSSLCWSKHKIKNRDKPNRTWD
jgi:hypothetical protein